MLTFKEVVYEDETGDYLDYHITDAYGEHLGKIIYYGLTGEYLYLTDNRGLVLTMDEIKEIGGFVDSLYKDVE